MASIVALGGILYGLNELRRATPQQQQTLSDPSYYQVQRPIDTYLMSPPIVNAETPEDAVLADMYEATKINYPDIEHARQIME